MAKIQLKSDNINPFGGDCPKSQTFLSENPESASEVSRSQGNFEPLLPTGPKAFFQCQITEAAISQDPESLLMNISSAHASRTELTLNMEKCRKMALCRAVGVPFDTETKAEECSICSAKTF